MNSSDSPNTKLYWIALLRIMLGVLFLTTWWSNFNKGFYSGGGLLNFFTYVFPQSTNPLWWYAAFIDTVILPIREVFAPFLLVGEFLIGFALLVGVLTPLTSIFAAIFIINTYFATFGHDWPWSYVMILGILFVVFVTKAGRSMGLDAKLFERRGDPPIDILW